MLSRAEPVLRRHNALFKAPRSLRLLATFNTGVAQFSQVGKFLTVYPRSTDEAVRLAAGLHLATRGLAGPRIPFEERYRQNSLVFYRYGSFGPAAGKVPGTIRDVAGRERRDERAYGKAVPSWLQDPFPKPGTKSRATAGPIGMDYLPHKALRQRGRGGVYEAVDISVSPTRLVVIKEGRRHGETDRLGKDGYARLKREGWLLRRLHAAGVPVPEVLREFRQRGNRYLVLEKVAGKPLLREGRLQPARYSWRRAARILALLTPLLSRLHAAGWVWRDCKPSHILISNGACRLIDFEDASRISDCEAMAWGVKHYWPPALRRKDQRPPGTFEDDYALGVIAFQFLAGRFPSRSAGERAKVYRRHRCPLELRHRIERLLLPGC
ncbi:MAG: hypothetical protein H0W20_11775 [Chthoniobacterales bacterium]|nr:hypothetical protein [Chthoniobacterales bacterium]